MTDKNVYPTARAERMFLAFPPFRWGTKAMIPDRRECQIPAWQARADSYIDLLARNGFRRGGIRDLTYETGRKLEYNPLTPLAKGE